MISLPLPGQTTSADGGLGGSFVLPPGLLPGSGLPPGLPPGLALLPPGLVFPPPGDDGPLPGPVFPAPEPSRMLPVQPRPSDSASSQTEAPHASTPLMMPLPNWAPS